MKEIRSTEKCLTLEQFRAQKTCGLVLRTFAPRKRDIPSRIKMVREAIQAALRMNEKVNFIRRIDVFVWADAAYAGSDCGDMIGRLWPAINEEVKLGNEQGVRIRVHNVTDGDIYCGILNEAIWEQKTHYSIIASAEASSYMTQETLEAMIEAARKGAKVIPVAVNELRPMIIRGIAANTFTMWENKALMKHGAFDLRAAKAPKYARRTKTVEHWTPEVGTTFVDLCGMEEIIPLIRLVRKYGKCIAPILPKGKGVQLYVLPNPQDNPVEYLRQLRKFETKDSRGEALALTECGSLSVIEGGVMDEYRQAA